MAAKRLPSVLARRPRANPESAPAVAAPAGTVTVEIHDEDVVANPASVAVGQRVNLAVVNRTRRTVRFGLSGYEGRLDVPPLAPDSTWRGDLVADRPGVQLAWLVDGEPRGRFDVAGSHLPEGHR